MALSSPVMTPAAGILYEFLTLSAGLSAPEFKLKESQLQLWIKDAESRLDPRELADLFVTSSFLASAGRPLMDLEWLQTHGQVKYQKDLQFIFETALERELKPIAFVRELLLAYAPYSVKRIAKASVFFLTTLGAIIRHEKHGPALHSFLVASMTKMRELSALEVEMLKIKNTALARYENRLRETMAGTTWPENRPLASETVLVNSLYRAFDELDQILGLNYVRDHGMKLVAVEGGERLYEGAGIGVQSSYSTLLITLEATKPRIGATFIDLGSGYGRAGFVIGLLRPDMAFVGYEYVQHRVEISQLAAKNACLGERVQFVEQNLADKNFQIPEADIYYMYDPFSQETYQFVFSQVKDLGKRRAITVATKGRASSWFLKAVESDPEAAAFWTHDLTFDEGTLGLFRSRSLK